MAKETKVEEVVANSYFDGKGLQRTGWRLLTFFVNIITIGIFALFIPGRIKKWTVKHTRFSTR